MTTPSISGLTNDLALATSGSKKPPYVKREAAFPTTLSKVDKSSGFSVNILSFLDLIPLPITSILFFAAGNVNPLAISNTVKSEPNAVTGLMAPTVVIAFRLAPKAGGITPVATPPSKPIFNLFLIFSKALSRPSRPTASTVSVGPTSKKSPRVCVPSVDTMASARPAAEICLAARPAL